MVIKILAILFVVLGAAVTYGASWIVDRFGIVQRVKVKEAQEFSPEDLEKYKRLKAMSMVKLAGLVALMPGVILIFVAFR